MKNRQNNLKNKIPRKKILSKRFRQERLKHKDFFNKREVLINTKLIEPQFITHNS